MVEATAIIQNHKGIHVRPSGIIFKALLGYSGKITVIKDGIETQINDIISILTLGLSYNSSINITVDGENEEEMLSTMKELFEKTYEFEEK